MYDRDTLAFYETSETTYRASGRGGVSRHLNAFLDLLPKGARILGLGCGGGTDAAEMRSRGFDVDATDGSPAIAAIAAERLGRPVRVMRFDELAVEQVYDAVWASAALLHVTRVALPNILNGVHVAIKPVGLHHASFKAMGSEGRDSDGRYFNHLNEVDLRAAYLACASPWDIIETTSYEGGGYPDGTRGPWVSILARRPL
jgi:SAM-dependent methyltransferase